MDAIRIGNKVKVGNYYGTVTGFNGTYYRVAMKYGNDTRHEWFLPEELELVK